jgi:aspartate racemase
MRKPGFLSRRKAAAWELFMKRLGVIGGLGPIATAYFYELIIKMTDARIDQEHIEMLIFSKPSIPDRTDYILGKSEDNPLYEIIGVGNLLSDMGADYIAIPCITAHYFNGKLTEGINAPMIHVIKETVRYLKDQKICRAGIMATEGTIYSRLFQNELQAGGIEAVIPSESRQKDVTDLIYKNVKATLPVELDKFKAVSAELRGEGAEVIILGCTELSLIKRDYDIGPGYLDAMEVLAMRSIVLCEGKLKEEYRSLIT